MKFNIKPVMQKLNITKYRLSKKTGISHPAISKIYNGEPTRMSIETLESLCKALYCTPNDLLVSDDPEVKERMDEYQEIIAKSKERPE